MVWRYVKMAAADLYAATGASGTAIANTATGKVLLAWGVNRAHGLCRGLPLTITSTLERS